ncbi:Internalin-A precursor [Eubacteriaceae bacterium CHKCI005]|nr:Internalin-A precursor [Eubacteriaceae bacterium CHKCI005]
MSKKIIALLMAVLLVCTVIGGATVLASSQEVSIPDPVLKSAVCSQLGISSSSKITTAQMEKLEGLAIQNKPSLKSLEGLEAAVNLQRLYVDNCSITSTAPLSGTASLEVLNLSGNPISDISGLAGLENLQHVYLADTGISDLNPLLASKDALMVLDIARTQVEDFCPLSSLHKLTMLDVSGNASAASAPLDQLGNLNLLFAKNCSLTSVESLASLTGLTRLDLDNNEISDLSPLASLPAIRELYLSGNPLTDSERNQAALGSLNSAGVKVVHDDLLPSDDNIYPEPEDPSLASDVYVLDTARQTVTGVSPETAVSDFLAGFESTGTLRLVDAGGQEVTSGSVGTGMMLESTDMEEPYTVIVYGDVTGDGLINIADLVAVQQHILGESALTGAALQAGHAAHPGDASLDEILNITDLVAIQQHILGDAVIGQK